MLGDARGHSSPHRQAHVVARFRMHLIHERLVVQEVDLDRPGRLDRLRTWYQLQTLMWLIRQRPVRLDDDGQGPAPSRHLVDASPELANRIRVVVEAKLALAGCSRCSRRLCFRNSTWARAARPSRGTAIRSTSQPKRLLELAPSPRLQQMATARQNCRVPL